MKWQAHTGQLPWIKELYPDEEEDLDDEEKDDDDGDEEEDNEETTTSKRKRNNKKKKKKRNKKKKRTKKHFDLVLGEVEEYYYPSDDNDDDENDYFGNKRRQAQLEATTRVVVVTKRKKPKYDPTNAFLPIPIQPFPWENPSRAKHVSCCPMIVLSRDRPMVWWKSGMPRPSIPRCDEICPINNNNKQRTGVVSAWDMPHPLPP